MHLLPSYLYYAGFAQNVQRIFILYNVYIRPIQLFALILYDNFGIFNRYNIAKMLFSVTDNFCSIYILICFPIFMYFNLFTSLFRYTLNRVRRISFSILNIFYSISKLFRYLYLINIDIYQSIYLFRNISIYSLICLGIPQSEGLNLFVHGICCLSLSF